MYNKSWNYVIIMAAVVALAVLSTCRSKAQTAPVPAPTERQFTVTLPLSQWQKIGDMLAEKPFKDVAPLINALQQQISAQDAKQQEEKSK